MILCGKLQMLMMCHKSVSEHALCCRLTGGTTETAAAPATAASSDSVGKAGAQPVLQNGS